MSTVVFENIDAIAEAMPRYKCHKIVRALKIDRIVSLMGGTIRLRFHGFPAVENIVDLYLETKGRPTPSVGWYLVLYDNGYYSFSPAAAFEEGYTLEPA